MDGFNLYHAIDKLHRPHLKWMDLRRLMTNFTDPAVHDLVRVYYFSAFATWLPVAHARHEQYVAALEQSGATPVLGQFKEKDRGCRTCGAAWVGHEEKETDVNIALYLLRDAFQNVYDEAFVVSRDSDLTPAIRMVLEHFPQKSIKVIAPPNLRHSKEMGKLVGKKKLAAIKPIHLERALLPAVIVDEASGRVLARRPDRSAPPSQ
ncbi:hypothetical protein C882_2167 [Caenispirillum salinarum AK4]|uniref:NYN domain-containing protein n=1 Tax=Caenispirillum salinarum AK4 TaxID=1238182 RepID=K9H8K2_9PROT|nr:hypothetical protein C882_2167 [Caenispirillum salinarum AK4]